MREERTKESIDRDYSNAAVRYGDCAIKIVMLTDQMESLKCQMKELVLESEALRVGQIKATDSPKTVA